jgi:Arc/MetJ-type ribon-helix-helix transcriptional regulator
VLAGLRKKRVEVSMADCYFEGMDLLIRDGLYETQAEIVKDALRRLFVHYDISLIDSIAES